MADYNEQEFDNHEPEQQEKTFTQAELDKIVQERIARVKTTVPEDYEDLKAIADELGELGYSGSAAEKKAAIKAYRDELKAQTDIQELEEQASITGTSPELLKEIREARKEAKEAKEALNAIMEKERANRAKAEEEQAKEQAVKQMYAEFEEKHPEIDIKELENNAKFVKFATKRAGTLVEIYEDYVDIIGEAEAELIAKVKDKSERSTGGGSAKDTSGGNYGLTQAQLKLLAEFNKGKTGRQIMTPKEFKELNS